MITKIKKMMGSGNSGMLFATIVLVNAGNYLINLFLGRILGPEDFAETGILATGVLILSFFALGFQMTAAKYSATYLAENANDKLAAFSQWFRRGSILAGLGLAALLFAFSGMLKDFLHFRSAVPFWLVAAGIPVYLSMSTGRGLLQGRLHFRKLAASYLMEMAVRLLLTAAAIAVLIYFHYKGFAEAVALGFLGAFVAAFLIGREKGEKKPALLGAKERKGILGFMFIVGSYELSQILISHSDVILVKHYFSNREAGLYTALALIGRIVFFATWSVVTLLFPKVVQREKMGLPHLGLFYRSLLIVMATGLTITVACFFFSDWIIFLLFGDGFSQISHLLWLYAAATTLFACANVFTYYYLSLNQYLPVVLSGGAGLLQIALITLFHESLSMIIFIQMGLMASLFVTMSIYHTVKNINNEKLKDSLSLSLSAQ